MSENLWRPGADWPLGHLDNARWAGLKMNNNRSNGSTSLRSPPHSLKDAWAGFETRSAPAGDQLFMSALGSHSWHQDLKQMFIGRISLVTPFFWICILELDLLVQMCGAIKDLCARFSSGVHSVYAKAIDPMPSQPLDSMTSLHCNPFDTMTP